MRCPVIESVVLSGWSKFHLFGGQVDDAIIGLGMVVATRGRMIVEISADPTGGVHQSFQCDRKVLTAAFLQGDHLTDMRKLIPVTTAVASGDRATESFSAFTVVLVLAPMSAIFRPQDWAMVWVQPKELSLAWKGSTGLIPHVKMYLRGLPHRRGHVHPHLVGLDVDWRLNKPLRP